MKHDYQFLQTAPKSGYPIYRCSRPECRHTLEVRSTDVQAALERQPSCEETIAKRSGVLQLPPSSTPEEIDRRQAICLACEDWDEELLGCMLVPELERKRLTEHKQAKGHCARSCSGMQPCW